MDHNPADVLAHHLAFPGVEAGADVETKRLDAIRYGPRTAYPTGWTIESREKSVAGRIDLTPSKSSELATYDFMVAVEQIVRREDRRQNKQQNSNCERSASAEPIGHGSVEKLSDSGSADEHGERCLHRAGVCVAPPISGLLVDAMGWQAIFWFLALFGAASLVALLKIVPETLESSRRATAGLRVTLLDYAGLFRRGRLAWLTLSSAFAMAGLFAYIGSSSFVFVDHFGLPPAIYSLVLAGIAVGMVIGGQINVLLLSRWTERQILVFGLLLHAACCVALLIATLAMVAGVLRGRTVAIAFEGGNFEVTPWDWRYFAEKRRKVEFDFDKCEIRPYLQLDRLIEAAFYAASRLFGLGFAERFDLKLYHPDARAWTVTGRSGAPVALFIGDFRPPSKRSGAWMSSFRGQQKLDGPQLPIVVNVTNFAKGGEGEASLLSCGGPSMRLGGRIDRPPRQALRARSHWDHALAARVATAR